MEKQKEVLNYLNTVEEADLSQIYENVSFSYFHNWKKHLGVLLSRMVNTGKIERIKPGVFKAKHRYYVRSKGNLQNVYDLPQLFDAQTP